MVHNFKGNEIPSVFEPYEWYFFQSMYRLVTHPLHLHLFVVFLLHISSQCNKSQESYFAI